MTTQCLFFTEQEKREGSMQKPECNPNRTTKRSFKDRELKHGLSSPKHLDPTEQWSNFSSRVMAVISSALKSELPFTNAFCYGGGFSS
jgi:hypothetical protein